MQASAPQASAPLEGLRVLVVEDNFLLAEVTKDLLEHGGCTVVRPTGWVESALKLARVEALDGAILDINLHGEPSFAVAEVLFARGIPFMFVTGYDDVTIMPATLRWARRLSKPVTDQQLLAVAAELFAVCAD